MSEYLKKYSWWRQLVHLDSGQNKAVFVLRERCYKELAKMQSLSFVCSKQPSFIRVLQNLNVVFASVSKMPFFSCFSLLEDEVIFFWTMTRDVITPMFITGMSDNWNSGNCESLCRFPQVQNSDARFSNGSGLCIYASSLCSYSFPGCSVRKPGSSLLKRLIVEAVAIFHSNNSCRNHAPLGQGRKQSLV